MFFKFFGEMRVSVECYIGAEFVSFEENWEFVVLDVVFVAVCEQEFDVFHLDKFVIREPAIGVAVAFYGVKTLV